MSDFERINQPRVDKIVAALAVIRKSARSNRADPVEAYRLTLPIRDALVVAFDPGDSIEAKAEEWRQLTAEPPVAPKRTTILEAPHIMRIGEFVAGLPIEHLAPMITHLTNRICEELETKGKGE